MQARTKCGPGSGSLRLRGDASDSRVPVRQLKLCIRAACVVLGYSRGALGGLVTSSCAIRDLMSSHPLLVIIGKPFLLQLRNLLDSSILSRSLVGMMF